MRRLPWADLRLALLVSILVLAGYIGVVEGFNDAHSARNLAETATAIGQLCYGALASLAMLAILRRHRFARPMLEFWGSIFVATAILAPVVAGNATVSKGIASGAAAVAIVALSVWLWSGNQIVVRQQVKPAQPAKAEPTVPVMDRWDRELAELREKMKAMDARHISGPQQIPRANPA